jgi:predicted phosphodiesterase
MAAAALTVAVLSDIHGVLPALEAVLAEPDVARAERVALLGDLAAGPLPVATLDLLASLGDRGLWIRGNADRELVEYARGERTEMPDPVSAWAARQLRPDQVELLAGLATSATLAIPGLGTTLFCHATPGHDEEVVLADSSLERWAEVLASLPRDVETVVCGHTHMPFIRLAHRRLVINPGSVGMPYGRPGAHWALLGQGAELRRTEFDPDAACSRIAAESGCSGAQEWADYFVRARASDAEAIAAFGPRDGRIGP